MILRIIFYLFLIPCILGKLLEDREVICTSDKIILNLAFNEPFDGVVFAENKYTDNECRWNGNGGKYILIVLPLENITTTAALGIPTNNGKCGLSYNPINAEHTLSFVISPDPIVLTDEAFSLHVKCVHTDNDILITLGAPSMDPIKLTNIESMTVLGTAGELPQLGINNLEGHGLFGKTINETYIGKRLTLDINLKNTSIYDMFVHDCIASDGKNDSSIIIIDSNGCAVPQDRAIDAPVFSSAPEKNAAKHVYIYLYGFQFATSDEVHFECLITPCIYECRQRQCQENSSLLPSSSILRGETLSSIKIKTILQIVNRNI